MIGKQDILHMSVVLRAAGIDSLDTPGTPMSLGTLLFVVIYFCIYDVLLHIFDTMWIAGRRFQ